MAELVKKLNIQKNGETTPCSIYTTTDEAGTSHISMKVDNVAVYVPIVPVGDDRASRGRIKNSGATQAIATTGKTPYGKMEYREPGTFTLTVPAGIEELKAQIAGAGAGCFIDEEFSSSICKGGNGDLQNIILATQANETISIVVGAGSVGENQTGGMVEDGEESKVIAVAGEYTADGCGAPYVVDKEPHNGVDAGNGQGGKGSASFDDSSGGKGEDGWVIIEWGLGR